MVYERAVRKCFENSMTELNSNLREIIVQIERSLGGKSLLNKDPGEDLGLNLEHCLDCGQDPVFWNFMEGKYVINISISYNKEAKILDFNPPLKEIYDSIFGLISLIKSEIENVPCIYTSMLNYAREDEKIHIFLEDDEFITSSFAEFKYVMNIILNLAS